MIPDSGHFNDSVTCFLLSSNDRLNAGWFSGILSRTPGQALSIALCNRVASKLNYTMFCETVFQKRPENHGLPLKIRTQWKVRRSKNSRKGFANEYQYGIDY